MNRYDSPRLESLEKADGSGLYTDDISPPGMIYGAVLRSPYPHAKVKSIDAAKVLALPGVVAVLLPDEVEGILYNSSGNPPSPLLLEDERILTDHPLFEGDGIAAVAAQSPQLCKEALALFRIDYEVLPAILSIDDAMRPGATLLHPDVSDSNDFCLLAFDKGDIETGLASCDIVLEDEFTTPAVHPLPLEPTGCICNWQGETLSITSTSQTLFQERRILAKMFGLPESSVRIIKPLMGSGFGARQQLHYQPVGCLLSKKAGRPVKMILTREEEMLATTTRHAAKMRVRLGAMLDGKIKAIDAEVWHDTGAYCTHGPIVLAAQGKKVQYDIEHYRYRGHCVYTNNVTAGAMRGYGNPQLTFAREMLIDRLARQLDRDPLELRLANHLNTGGRIAGTDTLVTSCQIQDCADMARRIQAQVDEKRGNTGHWGAAFAMHTSGPSNKSGLSSASIYVNSDGSVQLNLGTADIGQGSETAMAQVAAQILGIPLEFVRVHSADTQSTPYDTGTFASSQMFVGGNAVVLAAKATLVNMGQALATAMGLSHDDVSCENGSFTMPGASYTFSQAAKYLMYEGGGRVIFGEASYKAQEAPPVFAVCLARTEKNSRTGAITVTDIIETVDVGTVINRGIVLGQIEGGIVQGLGYGWMERLQRVRRSGKHITSDTLHYKVPTSLDMPELYAGTVNSYDPYGPLGAKSVGELTLVPVAAALAASVERATGNKVNSLPFCEFALLGANMGEE
ncbi:MAG: xanthine dehydrogenase family protein molybdopterin-binding subunit [Spirochaetes bacterium]|nr:xanthine dehydrogenase family protein molybdopterin-binding subunit [Spirochaetota bacterium]